MKRKILLSLVAGLILPLFAQRTFPIKNGKLLSDLDGGAFTISNVHAIVIDGVPVTSNLLHHLGYSNIEEQFEVNVVKGYSVLRSTDEDVPTNTFFTGIFNTARTLTNTTQNLEIRYYTLSNSVDYIIERTNNLPALVVDSIVTNPVLSHTFYPIERQYWSTNYFNVEVPFSNTQVTLGLLVLTTNFFQNVPTSIPVREYVDSYNVSGSGATYSADVTWKFTTTTNYSVEVEDPLEGTRTFSGPIRGGTYSYSENYVIGTNKHVLITANTLDGYNSIPCYTNAMYTIMSHDYVVTTNYNVVTNYAYTTVPSITVSTNNLTYTWKGWVISEIGSTNILYFQSSPRSPWFINNSDNNKMFKIKKNMVLELNTIPLSHYRMEKDSFFVRFKSLAVGLCIGNAYAQEIPYTPPFPDLIDTKSPLPDLRNAIRKIQEYINRTVEEEYVEGEVENVEVEEEVENDPTTEYIPTPTERTIVQIIRELPPEEEDHEEATKKLKEEDIKKEEARKEGNDVTHWEEILAWGEQLKNDIMNTVKSESEKRVELKAFVDVFFDKYITDMSKLRTTVDKLGTDFETLKNDTTEQYSSVLTRMENLENRMASLETKQASADGRIDAIQNQVNESTPNIQNIYFSEGGTSGGDIGYSGGGGECFCDTSAIDQVLEEMGLLPGSGFGNGSDVGEDLF